MPPDGIRTLNSNKRAAAAPRLIHFWPTGMLANWTHFLYLCVLEWAADLLDE